MIRCISLLLLVSAMVLGCAHKRQISEVVTAEDTRRDTEKARSENEKAVNLIEKGRYDDAEKALKQAVDADAMYGPAHNNLGKVYYHQERLYDAAVQFEYANKLMPTQGEPLYNLGMVLEAAGKMDEAMKQYEAALALDPQNPYFIGNVARIQLRRGEKNSNLREMLSTLIMRDDRPEWVKWAREQLSLLGEPVRTPNTKQQQD